MQTDKEAMWEFVRGASLTVFVLLIFLGFLSALGEFDPPPAEKFVIETSYKGCEVVRYTDDSQRWHYFLDCREVR